MKHARSCHYYRILFATILFVLSSVVGAQAQEPVAKVVELLGDWYLYRGNIRVKKLEQWYRLPSRGIIRASAPSTTDFIVLVDHQDRLFEVRRCADLSLCTRPIYLPSAPRPGESPAQIDLRDTWERLWEDPPRYSLHRSRGVADDSPSTLVEGVVAIQAGRLDLSGVARPSNNDPIQLYLQELPPAAPAPAPIGPLLLERDPPGVPFVRVPSLKPGIYEIGLLTPRPSDGQLVHSGSPVWVLVCTPDALASTIRSFEEAAVVARSWAPAVSAGTVHSFLRARLVSLARSVCGVSP